MVRTQIQLTEDQARRLRAWARAHEVSLAEAIRRCVDRALDEGAEELRARYARAAPLVGRFEDPSGVTDLSIDHDRYLDRPGE